MRTQLPRASRLMAITRVPVIIAFAFWTRPLHSAEVGNYMGLVSASYSELLLFKPNLHGLPGIITCMSSWAKMRAGFAR